MSDKEYAERCAKYNGEVDGFGLLLAVWVFALVVLTTAVAAYLGMTDWWLTEVLGGLFLLTSCYMVKESILDNLLMFWRSEDE